MAAEDFPQFDNEYVKHNGREEKRKKKDKKRQKKLAKDSCCQDEEEFQVQEQSNEGTSAVESAKRKKRKRLLKDSVESSDKVGALDKGGCGDGLDEGNFDRDEAKENVECDNEREENTEIKRKKKRLLAETAKAGNRGICYLSRIPPHMDPFKLRQILSQFGDINRIYLSPQNSAAQVRRKPGGRRQDRSFTEGWVEFNDKRIAKRVANMLNGEQIGGRKKSSFYYDLWNIKYLSKFKWDDLTEEIAYKKATREQKLALELSAATREKDFYLSKVDKARALSSIEERLKKKQKINEESGVNDGIPAIQAPKIVRKVKQTKPIAHNVGSAKPRLSKDILAGVFGGS